MVWILGLVILLFGLLLLLVALVPNPDPKTRLNVWQKAIVILIGGVLSYSGFGMMAPSTPAPIQAASETASEPMTTANTDKATFEAAEAESARQIRESAEAPPQPAPEPAPLEPEVDKDGFIRPTNPAPGLAESDEITNPQPVTITYINDDSWFGCLDRDVFGEIVQFAVQKDSEAYSKAILEHLMIGDCIAFPKYLRVIRTADSAVFSGLVKVRKQGDTTWYYTNMEAISQKEVTQ